MKSFLEYLNEEKDWRDHPHLKGLAAEAKKYDTPEEFEKDFLVHIKHGKYWHITDNPNFKIDSLKGPRDMSSIASGQMEPGKLMITSHLEHWTENYPNRKYAAMIDMSDVHKSHYWQVKRGFGNEFWVEHPDKAKVMKVLPIHKALSLDRRMHKTLAKHILSSQDLHHFWKKHASKS